MAKFNWKVQSLKGSIKLEGRRIAAMSKRKEKLGAGTHTCRSMLAYATGISMGAMAPQSDRRAGRDVPNCPFDGQLNRISRNNGALNLLRFPRESPERGRRGERKRFSLIYAGRLGFRADPVFGGPVCQLVIEEHRAARQRRQISNDRLGSTTPDCST